MPQSLLTLRTPPDFELKRAVCSYGYFLLAPNGWRPDTLCLERPLLLATGELVKCRIDSPPRDAHRLRIHCDTRLDASGRREVKQAVARMLRIEEKLPGWGRLNPAARRRRFGRMFRSPTLFEDMVKTITGCNVTWRNTMAMNRRLVASVGGGAFPSPAQLARWTPSRLKRSCRVGYRAQRIIRLARAFERGKIAPGWYESPDRTADELYASLLKLDGFGPYAAANVLQLLGHYDHLPIDTETYRHYCHLTGQPRPANDKQLDPLIETHYEPFRPYRFLAYWFDLWRDYERRYGDAWEWDPETTGANFTASVLK